MIVSQLMSREVVTCRPQDSLRDAAEKMWNQDIGCLPVVDEEGHAVGMVTDRDICMAAYTQGRPLADMDVRSAMAHEVFSCLPTERIEQAEKIMKDRQVRRLPVIDEGGHLVGLIATNDLARESARQLARKGADVTADALAATLASICAPRSRGQLVASAE